MLTLNYLSFYFPQTLARSLLVSILTTFSILGGVVPELSRQTPQLIFNFTPNTQAQEFSNEQIRKYAQAVLEIEDFRQQAFQEIQTIIGTQPPDIVCNQPNTFRNLPRDARKIAANDCRTSKTIVQRSGLGVAVFNNITVRAQSNQNLKKKIQNFMIQIRRQP